MARTTSGPTVGPEREPVAGQAWARLGREQRRVFLDHLAATGNVRKAAAAAERGASSFYALRRLDAEFSAAWEAAVDAACDRIEEALIARALEQVAAEQFDPGAVTLELVHANAAPATGNSRATGPVAKLDVQLALAVLGRRAATERKGRARSGRRRLTAAELEKALNARLDRLARRITPLGGEDG